MPNTFNGYKYSARLIRAKDGDTLVVSLDLGMGIYKTETVRLRNVDTEELRDKNKQRPADRKFCKKSIQNEQGLYILRIQKIILGLLIRVMVKSYV